MRKDASRRRSFSLQTSKGVGGCGARGCWFGPGDFGGSGGGVMLEKPALGV